MLPSRSLPLAGTILVLAAVSFLAQRLDEPTLAALAMPSVLYAGVLVAAAERLFISRLLGAAALTSIVPAAYAAATGALDGTAAVLWAVLGGSLPFLQPRREGLVARAAHTLY